MSIPVHLKCIGCPTLNVVAYDMSTLMCVTIHCGLNAVRPRETILCPRDDDDDDADAAAQSHVSSCTAAARRRWCSPRALQNASCRQRNNARGEPLQHERATRAPVSTVHTRALFSRRLAACVCLRTVNSLYLLGRVLNVALLILFSIIATQLTLRNVKRALSNTLSAESWDARAGGRVLAANDTTITTTIITINTITTTTFIFTF